MSRFVRLVDKENKIIGYKDPLMVGFYDDEPDEHKFVSKDECISKFRVFTRNKIKRQYIAKKTCEAALKSDFLVPGRHNSILLLKVTPDKGEDFIEGLGLIGIIRELHKKDRDLIVFVFSVITFAVGIYVGVIL